MPLGWLQLRRQRGRLFVALFGVAFAVVLILMQLGFRDSMFESAVQIYRALRYDVILVSPSTDYIGSPVSFSRRRLYEALGEDGVASVTPVYGFTARWKNPDTHVTRAIHAMGIDASDGAFEKGEILDQIQKIRRQDVVLFDARSRPEFGPIAQRFEAGQPVHVEVNNREIRVDGLYHIGTSFGITGSLVTSDVNFLRLFPNRPPGLIDLGLIRLEPGSNPDQVARRLRQHLAPDVLVLTREESFDREKTFWDSVTPIGYVFSFGVVVGLFVGGIIVYQILFADVADHIAEYATLKALGYSNAYLSGVVIEESVILALLGYVPGLLIALLLYRIAGSATHLPITMTFARALAVLGLTIAMCVLSGFIALRKVRTADPVENF